MADQRATPAVCIVVSVYNATITAALRDGAAREYARRGGDAQAISVIEAPGAFELIAIADAAARSGRFAAVVALGCIIRGETDHDRYLAHAVAGGLAASSVQSGVPIAFGVLTVNTIEQALARSGHAVGQDAAEGNKGAEAMAAALEAAAAIEAIRRGDRRFALSSAPADKLASGALTAR